MEMPTIEALGKEKEIYTAYLKKGGKPIQIHLEMRPIQGVGALNWSIAVEIPDDIPRLKWTLEFAAYIKDQIVRAIQPPKL